MNMKSRHRRSLFVFAAAIAAISSVAPIFGQVTRVEDINLGEEGMGVYEFWTFQGVPHGSALYFAATTTAAGTEPWVATSEGASPIEDIRAGTSSSDPRYFADTATAVYFTAATSEDVYDRTLWRSDGTEDGTYSLGVPAGMVVEMGGSVYFLGYDANKKWQLWKASGDTPERVSDLNSENGGTSTDGLAVIDLEGEGEWLFFFALDYTPELDLIYALWKSNGTTAGTVEVKDIADGATAYVTEEIVGFDGRAFFPASDVSGNELWASDGTGTGTVQIKDISASGSSNPHQLTVVGDQLFFIATDDTYGRELWVSDGTSNGTHIVQNLAAGSESSDVNNLTAYDGTLYFTVTTSESGNELWASDGTAGGTAMVVDLFTGFDGSGDPYSSSPKDLAVAGGLLFFSAADTGLHGRELWVSDGTAARTLLVHDLKPISYDGEVGPRGMIEVGDDLFFFADDGVIGHELYMLPTADVIGQPTVSDGPTSGRTEEAYTYTASGGVSVRGGQTQFKFHWGDESDSGWLTAGENQAEKTWDDEADYDVWAEAKSDSGSSNASAVLTVDIDFTEWVSAVGSGPTEGFIDNEYSYTITGESSYGHDLEYAIDWGDGGTFDWEAATWATLDTETNDVTLNHTWTEYSDYVIEPRVRCATHNQVWGRYEVYLNIVHETIAEPTISGPDIGWTDTEYTFTIGGESDAGHDLEYNVLWNDDSETGWTAFGDGVTSGEALHTWASEGTFAVNLGVRCVSHPSHINWSETSIEISSPPDEELTGPDLEGDWESYPDISLDYTLSAFSNLDHDLQYRVTWGDGGDTGWVNFGTGVTSMPLSHTWTEQVTDATEYLVTAWVRCKEHPDPENDPWNQWSVWILPEAVADKSLTGPSSGVAGVSYDYTLTAHSESGHQMQYQIYWGHGDGPGPDDWFDLDPVSGSKQLAHTWPIDGKDHDYSVDYGVRCKEHPNAFEEWDSIIVSIPGETITNHTLEGPTEGLIGVDYDFTVSGTSPGGHSLEYKFDWGDDFPTGWQSLGDGTASESYHWAYEDEFTVTSSVRCATHNHVLSEKTTVVTITSDTPPGWIFGDDFEFGDLEDWSAAVGVSP